MRKKIIILFIILFFSKQNAFCFDYYINVDWFKKFNDQRLLEYIICALENNKDVIIAKKNILKYRQEKNLAISKIFPEINVGADYLLVKIPKSTFQMDDIKTNSFALPFYTNWEIDYLGKNYNKIAQSKLDIKNAHFDLKSSNLIVATDTASNYFNISNLNYQIKVQNNINNIRKEILDRRKKMFYYGIISAIELNETRREVEEGLVELENLYKKREIFITELLYLLGKSPYNSDEIEVCEFESIDYTGVFPEYLEGSIISNRPDILKLESEIERKKIDITLAKKDFLPNITLNGTFAFSTISGTFGFENAFAGMILGAAQNLFDGGKRIFNFKKSKIEYDIALENYLKGDIKALKEVNDAIYTLKKDVEIYENNKKILSIENSNFTKVFKSFNSGKNSYVDYILENKNLLEDKRTVLNSKNQNFINLLSLYKTVGGALK